MLNFNFVSREKEEEEEEENSSQSSSTKQPNQNVIHCPNNMHVIKSLRVLE
jgi:hypothetical protein